MKSCGYFILTISVSEKLKIWTVEFDPDLSCWKDEEFVIESVTVGILYFEHIWSMEDFKKMSMKISEKIKIYDNDNSSGYIFYNFH